MSHQRASLDWRDGDVPVSTRFDDPYFSIHDGQAETEHVFLNGNDLPRRFRDGFHIAELGFGTGLNFLLAWARWRQCKLPGQFHFTSFEAFPMERTDMARALSAFPGLKDEAEHLLEVWNGEGGLFAFDGVTLEVIEGDARKMLPQWQDKADTWFLDGFAPAKNPELWEEGLLVEVARHMQPGATLATYSAAGHVRRGLEAAGLRVERVAGYGRKRHMVRAFKEPRE